MSFNPLAALEVHKIAVSTPDRHSSVVELGNQTLRCQEVFAKLGLAKPWPETTAAFYAACGYRRYTAIDVNERHGSQIMDLNGVLAETCGYTDTFSLVTNNGTGEHIFNQLAVFANCHNLCETGGLMLHIMPCMGWINHGFFQYQPKLYVDLAYHNGYHLRRLALATRDGKAKSLLAEEGELRLPTAGELKRSTAHARDKLRKIEPSGRFIVAVLQKTMDKPFRIPCDGKYLDAIEDQELKARYAP